MQTFLAVTTAAKKLPVSLDRVKRHLGVSGHDRDLDIEGLIKAAANELVRRTGRALTETTLAYSLSDWPDTELEIPFPPLGTLSSVDYLDTDGSQQTLAASQYQVVQRDGLPAIFAREPGVVWPGVEDERRDAITLNYTAGTDTLDDIPEEAKLYILMRVRYWFDHPDGEPPPGSSTWSDHSTRGLNSLVRSLYTGTYVAPHVY